LDDVLVSVFVCPDPDAADFSVSAASAIDGDAEDFSVSAASAIDPDTERNRKVETEAMLVAL
jgi:hypothetical protein